MNIFTAADFLRHISFEKCRKVLDSVVEKYNDGKQSNKIANHRN